MIIRIREVMAGALPRRFEIPTTWHERVFASAKRVKGMIRVEAMGSSVKLYPSQRVLVLDRIGE